jgi:hypothetical protein
LLALSNTSLKATTSFKPAIVFETVSATTLLLQGHPSSLASQSTTIQAKRGLVPLASQQVWRANIDAGYHPNEAFFISAD